MNEPRQKLMEQSTWIARIMNKTQVDRKDHCIFDEIYMRRIQKKQKPEWATNERPTTV